MNIYDLADLATPWCVHVAATLRVADHIAAGHAEITDLASVAGAHPESLHLVLRQLVRKGLFEEPSAGHFALNDLARELLGEPALLGLDLEGFGGRMANAWATLLPAVRTGQCAYHEAFGLPFWEDLAAHPAIAARFDALLGPDGHGLPDPDVLVDPVDWAVIRTVADVGGGNGVLLAEILRARPQLRGILIDLPSTLDRSGAVLGAAGVSGRVTLAPQSFFDPLPPGADLYLLKSVIPNWPDNQAVQILRRCAEAARPHGRVVVFTYAGPGEETHPGLLMFVLVGGKERTFEELTTLAARAGLALSATRRQPSGKVLVEFRPV